MKCPKCGKSDHKQQAHFCYNCGTSLDDAVSTKTSQAPKSVEAVDLGLPSGTLWASCNVGATTPEGYGCYYAWGETEEKSEFSWETYGLCEKSRNTCHTPDVFCCTTYDVAHVEWGGSWQMPTDEQIKELIANCTYEWTTLNGINGGKFISKINGNSIFLPAAGNHTGLKLEHCGKYGEYWSGTQNQRDDAITHIINFDMDSAISCNETRCCGLPVRPVWVEQQETSTL